MSSTFLYLTIKILLGYLSIPFTKSLQFSPPWHVIFPSNSDISSTIDRAILHPLLSFRIAKSVHSVNCVHFCYLSFVFYPLMTWRKFNHTSNLASQTSRSRVLYAINLCIRWSSCALHHSIICPYTSVSIRFLRWIQSCTASSNAR